MGCVLPASLTFFSESPASPAEVPHVWTTSVQVLRQSCALFLPSIASPFTAVSVFHSSMRLARQRIIPMSSQVTWSSFPHLHTSHVCSVHGPHLDFISPEVIPFSKLDAKYCNSSAPSPMIHCNSSWLHLPCWRHFYPRSPPPSDSYSLLFCLASVFPVIRLEVLMPSDRGIFQT